MALFRLSKGIRSLTPHPSWPLACISLITSRPVVCPDICQTNCQNICIINNTTAKRIRKKKKKKIKAQNGSQQMRKYHFAAFLTRPYRFGFFFSFSDYVFFVFHWSEDAFVGTFPSVFSSFSLFFGFLVFLFPWLHGFCLFVQHMDTRCCTPDHTCDRLLGCLAVCVSASFCWPY